ncbi:MAG: SDR family NAD(P)-dependent oxidoreductase [Anaerolineales bacterium]|nr:SDR family NAD(P)-dependent oxidoreductase [Anaerolineales bacterium]
MCDDVSTTEAAPAPIRRAVITGATGGLGKAFAAECASRGWDLFLTDVNENALSTLAGGLRNAHAVDVRYAGCDLTDPEARLRLIRKLRSRPDRVWMLINVAGTDSEGAFFEQPRSRLLTILRLNIEAALDLTRSLLEQRDPFAAFRIINVASLAAFYPMPMKATYAASKRFLLDFSLALNEEVRELGATVTALCPGGLYTNDECIRAIEAQGLAGHLSAQSIGSVAAATLDCALEGRQLYIPGAFNQILRHLGGWVPAAWVARVIGRRWKTVRRKRMMTETAAQQS